MTCSHCEKSRTTKFCGLYNLVCLDCCARLVVSARNVGRAQQEGMLAVIARAKGAPKREEVLNYMREHYPQKG